MSHEVTIRENGRAEAVYAFQPAWHGLGVVLDECPDSNTALKEGSLLWDVEQHQLQAQIKREELDNEGNTQNTYDTIPIPGRVANIRSDNNMVLGIVSKHYKVVQNTEAFKFMDDLLESGEIVKYESAGSLKGGKVVWVLARMPGDIEITDKDIVQKYVLFTNSHDGSKAIQALPTSVRVVCWNTLNLALEKESKVLSIRHMGNLQSKLKEARTVLGLTDKRFNEFSDRAKALMSTDLSHDEIKDYFNSLYPDREEAKYNTRRENIRNRLMELVDEPTQTLPGMSGTAWAAWNAVTQYIDHESTVYGQTDDLRAENKMNSTMLGHGNRIKTKAMEMALAI